MSSLLGPDGQPIKKSSALFKKAPPPALGEKYGQWGGEDVKFLQLPGGGFLQFNLDNLDIGDFRQMKDHYQINSSLAILTFMMHQVEWHIECENKKLADLCEEQLKNVWSRLVRAKSQAFWAGYSPNVLQWDNNVSDRSIDLDKIKDLIPDDCKVHWKTEKGSGDAARVSPRIKIYDGIDQLGWPGTIPVENSYWYPLLMENGNYYGRKLLRPAFQPWFFSILIHLFANRYFERFGEPTPVGRAPYEDTVEYNGKSVSGREAMIDILSQLRSRGVVVLPNDKSPNANETSPDFDYTIEYLESQMRGADFEKYLTRLDEEMSLGLFTPILLMRTAEVGSYNLGVGHMQVYLWMLNAISADWAHYLNKYILAPMARFNYGENHPPVKIKFRKLGSTNEELVRDLISQGARDGKFKFDLVQLSEMGGLTIEEQAQLTEPAAEPGNQPEDDDGNPTSRGDGGEDKEVPTTVRKIAARIAPQVEKAYARGDMPIPDNIDFGFDRALRDAFSKDGAPMGLAASRQFKRTVELYMQDCESMSDDFSTPAQYMEALERVMMYEAGRLTNG